MKLKHQMVEQLLKEEKQKVLSCLGYVHVIILDDHCAMLFGSWNGIPSLHIILYVTAGPKKA